LTYIEALRELLDIARPIQQRPVGLEYRETHAWSIDADETYAELGGYEICFCGF